MPILLIMAMSLFFSSFSFAKFNECYKEISQAAKNECMLFERDKSVGKLMAKITKWCADKEELKASVGGSIYPMLLDECMAKKIDYLSKHIEN
jgi:hypothetical protein